MVLRWRSYLSEAEQTPTSMHVIYINTSLRTKALAHQKVKPCAVLRVVDIRI